MKRLLIIIVLAISIAAVADGHRYYRCFGDGQGGYAAAVDAQHKIEGGKKNLEKIKNELTVS